MTKTELKKIRPMLEEIVENKLLQLLGDNESGLQLKDSVRRRLKKSLHSKASSVSAAGAARNLGLHW